MKLTKDDLFYFKALDSAAGINAKDCLVQDNTISFVVRKKDFGRAIGKNASNVKRLKARLKKNVEIFEYCKSVEKFIRRAFYNISIKEINTEERNGKSIVLLSLDSENRLKLLSNSSKLKRVKQLAVRNYAVNDLRIR